MLYMLDTNIASHIIKGDIPKIRTRLVQVPTHSVIVSVITQAELLYGVEKRGNPEGLATRVREFLARVEIIPWTPEVGVVYGRLRANCEAGGITLAPMDLMIAAHVKALSQERPTVLVTRDRAFSRVPGGGLDLEDWSQ